MRVLLTGATAPLGRAVFERLHALDQVVVLDEEPDPGWGVPWEVGDVGDPAAIRRIAPGCHVIVHPTLESTPATTRCLVETTWALGVKRAVILCEPEKARIAADLGALALVPAPLRLAPADPLGHAAALRAWALDASAPPFDAGGSAFVDLRDVIGAVEGALSRGTAGQVYDLASRNITWRRLWGRLRRMNLPRPPTWPALALGKGSHFVDDQRARKELGWWTREPERTLRECLLKAP